MSKVPHIILSLLLLQTPIVAQAQDPSWVDTLLIDLLGLIPLVVTMLIGVALVVFLIGLARFILQSGSEEAVQIGKQYMVWGVVALFVLVSVWGLVLLLQQMVGIDNTYTPSSPVIVNPL